MSDFFLYNTLSRKIEKFVPYNEGCVSIYSCGPTVYGIQHIGNMRSVFYVDFLKKVIKNLAGYPVKHVMNITDVGHLTGDNEGDANNGEDRMEKGAKRDGLSVRDVAEKYTTMFFDDITWLGANNFDVFCKATDHIDEQINMIEEMSKNGITYIIEGDGIYCDTSKVESYGKLLPKGHLEGIQAGARIDADGKRNPTDFALWKFSPRDENRQMEWVFEGVRSGELITDQNRNSLSSDELKTRGFPGRHIECSAMSFTHLGNKLDIHTGGIEHIPVHHTNEIVQAENSFCQTPRTKYRFHLQHLQLEGEKISKSIGNVRYISDIKERGYQPGDLRLYFFQAHYRNFQDFTWTGLDAAQKTRHNIAKKLKQFQPLPEGETGELFIELSKLLLNDLDTVGMIALLHKSLHDLDRAKAYDILKFDERVLGLGLAQLTENQNEREIPDAIVQLAQERIIAKEEKNYEKADELREEIEKRGYSIEDTASGYKLI